MTPHAFPPIKKNKKKLADVNNVATYQIGVDILGFPIYVEHYVYRGENEINKFNPIKIHWVKVFENIVKQH